MVQWLVSDIINIKNKNGEIRKIKFWRNRLKYDKNQTYIGTVLANEELRIDTLAERLISEKFNLGKIIDVNDVDVLSFKQDDKINYFLTSIGI